MSVSFHLCCCLQVSQATLPQKCPSPAPVLTPHFVSTLSYTSPVTWHHTSWLLSPQPLSFDSIPTLMLRGGHSMPLMWPWPHVPPARLADPGAVGPSSTLGDWWQGCPLLSPSTPYPRLGGQHSVSWAHLCGAQELHLKRRHHSCLVPHDSLGDTKHVWPSFTQPHLHRTRQYPQSQTLTLY